MQEKGIIVTSMIFGAMGLHDMTVHSLSLIVPHAEMKRYLQLHELCLAWISYFIAKLRILLEKVKCKQRFHLLISIEIKHLRIKLFR